MANVFLSRSLYERMLYAVRCLKSNEDMILALADRCITDYNALVDRCITDYICSSNGGRQVNFNQRRLNQMVGLIDNERKTSQSSEPTYSIHILYIVKFRAFVRVFVRNG